MVTSLAYDRRSPVDTQRRSPEERNALVEYHLPLAYRLARRFLRPGVVLDDLRQVAAEALVRAAANYRPERGVPFTAYAVPTIAGALKRHFRDQAWAVRPPRPLQERALLIGSAVDELGQQLGRSPSTSELATYLQLTVVDVTEAIECASTYHSSSLDAEAADRAPAALRLLSADDTLEKVESLAALRPLIAALPERDRMLLALRFGEELTQTQIATRFGVSQMQVSRMLRSCLHRLRKELDAEG